MQSYDESEGESLRISPFENKMGIVGNLGIMRIMGVTLHPLAAGGGIG